MSRSFGSQRYKESEREIRASARAYAMGNWSRRSVAHDDESTGGDLSAEAALGDYAAVAVRLLVS